MQHMFQWASSRPVMTRKDTDTVSCLQPCNPFGGAESCMTLSADSKFAQVCSGHDLKVLTAAMSEMTCVILLAAMICSVTHAKL